MSDNNTYIALRTKKRPVKEAMDFSVKIVEAWRMTGMWLVNMWVYMNWILHHLETLSVTQVINVCWYDDFEC